MKPLIAIANAAKLSSGGWIAAPPSAHGNDDQVGDRT